MGGGDLNTKKSWHPNTMKNQERVWKAEQAAAEEKKRIMELQREREEERDRTQLKDMAQRNFGAHSSSAGDNRLHWMYDKPDKQTQQEDYLLGKEIGKSDGGDQPQSGIPALSRRVVGSSMMTTADDTQVDLARKLREDPLLLVKERERAARAALLNNPLQRKKLTELLRKEQERKEQKRSKCKKKNKKKDKDLDEALAAKLNALAGQKPIDLNSLLNSDDSSDSSSEDDKPKKKKKRKKDKKSRKTKKQPVSFTESGSSDQEDSNRQRKSHKNDRDRISSKSHKRNRETMKPHSDHTDESNDESIKKQHKLDSKTNRNKSENNRFKNKQEESEWFWSDNDWRRKNNDKQVGEKRDSNNTGEPLRGHQRDDSTRRNAYKREHSPKKKYDDIRNKKQSLNKKEKAARLAAMVAAGAEREIERGERVARQRAEDNEAASRAPRHTRHETRALPDSLESRIKSNRHYIQRDRLHMNEHFARR